MTTLSEMGQAAVRKMRDALDSGAVRGAVRKAQDPAVHESVKRFSRRAEESLRQGGYAKAADVFGALSRAGESLDNVVSARNGGPAARRYSAEEAPSVFRRGDHIAVDRGSYTHHGIYDGGGRVWQYNHYRKGEPPMVTLSAIEKFARGGLMYRVESAVNLTPDEIIARAASRLHETRYDLLFNNCEHFARWCRYDPARDRN